MTFAVCLARLEAEGVIDRERAERFRTEYERLNAAYGKRMGEAAAAEQASRDALDALERQALRDRRQSLLQIQTQRGLLEGLTRHVEAGGKAGQFAISVMEHHEAVAGSIGVENRRGALYRLAWSRMGGFLSRYERNLLGRVNRGDELRELVRVLRGEASDNENAREMAGAVADTFEWLRQMFNQAGGDIAKLEGWGLPQSHDALAVAQEGFDAWWAFHRPLLDAGKMIDNQTGKAFASEEALEEAAKAAWKNIASEGMDGQIPGAFTGQGKMANRRSDHRFFIYKDADAWLAYHDRYGRGDVLDAITGHVDSMTRDIAAMQALGPNPAATVRWLSDLLQQDAAPTLTSGKNIALEQKASKGAAAMRNMWEYYSGALTAVPPEYRGQARFFAGIRNLNVAAKLGRAAVSAITTDPVFMGMTARFNGLPITGEMTAWLRGFAGNREAAEHAGLVFGEMIQRAERMYREGQGVNIHELTRRGADGVLRVSLLTPHTVAAKQAIGLGFMKDWADHAGEAFADLAGPKRMALERYGIDAADWDRLRAMPAAEQGPYRLLRPGDLARTDEAGLKAAIKFFSLIDSETRFGVPGESLRAQAAIASLNNPASEIFRRGTVGGELLHSSMQFKTYSVIMMTTQLQRALYGRGGMSGVGYALALPTFLLLGGYLATALNDIADGKDPPPIDEPITWARAFARSGGLGIVGDLISQGLTGSNRAGGGIAGFVMGPTMGSVVDPAYNLTVGNAGKLVQDRESNISGEIVRAARNMTPGGNIWYTRLAYNRLWSDWLQEMTDPGYAQSLHRMERQADQQGTQYWWHPGDTSPERAPELGNAAGRE